MLKLIRKLEWVLSALAALALLLMMLVSLGNALSRTWFQAPLYGANEIVSQWFLPAAVLLSIAGAQVWKQHIDVTLAIETLNPRNLAWIRLIVYSLSAAVCVAFAWYGFLEALKQTGINATAGITSLPTWPSYYLVPLGFTVAAIVFVLDAWMGFKKPEHPLNTGTGKPIFDTGA
ncbi:TRAP transporter small permease [Dietzia natronolimnaea]|uniref:TRAP transporter small permease n=1 Tax=Dietzia natronolimnaea TaxID=161920 RepID=UPI0015FC6606|nr:TRAP transporter small permease [Dietzia natronolimnaea]MBB1037671.1 TRAP transporter small permease [Dietzia natronolimnaea]